MKNPTREEIERSVEGLKRFDSGDRIVALARNLGKLCLRLLDENERLDKELHRVAVENDAFQKEILRLAEEMNDEESDA